MNNWNKLLLALDKTIGFPNKIRSSVKKRWQGYDMWKNEHVIWLEYRVKVNSGNPSPRPPQFQRDVHRDPIGESESMAAIRELMELESYDAGDYSASAPSPAPSKKAKRKSAGRRR